MAVAPTAGSRPGWSRRAQYSLFFSLLATIAGVVVGLILLALSLVAPRSYAAVRGAALDATAPVTAGLRAVTSTVGGLVSGATDYWDAARQNGDLKRLNQKLLQRMVEAKAIQLENGQLKAALQLRERSRDAVATGRIVGSSYESPRRFAVLSAGSGDGVQIGMPVRSAAGLIGRVMDTGRFASRVLLISDRANIVPARLLRGGLPVISTGRGDGTLDVRPLEVGRNPFKPGDLIITSGTGGLYPPLVPVARIVKLDDDGAVALPLADPANVSFALVERPFEPLAEEAPPPPPAPPPPKHKPKLVKS
ncbi:MAG: rod shape-determining protein MreC [Sphingomicrobium sp.]|nr:rod shape-determining protein MreC [Sphingomonadales bacterium]